jgi:hypothetical protein
MLKKRLQQAEACSTSASRVVEALRLIGDLTHKITLRIYLRKIGRIGVFNACIKRDNVVN